MINAKAAAELIMWHPEDFLKREEGCLIHVYSYLEANLVGYLKRPNWEKGHWQSWRPWLVMNEQHHLYKDVGICILWIPKNSKCYTETIKMSYISIYSAAAFPLSVSLPSHSYTMATDVVQPAFYFSPLPCPNYIVNPGLWCGTTNLPAGCARCHSYIFIL